MINNTQVVNESRRQEFLLLNILLFTFILCSLYVVSILALYLTGYIDSFTLCLIPALLLTVLIYPKEYCMTIYKVAFKGV